MFMKNILVTGGSGKAGRATIKLLLEKNYNVFNVDFVNNPELDVPFTKVHLEDFGDALEVVSENGIIQIGGIKSKSVAQKIRDQLKNNIPDFQEAFVKTIELR